MEPIRVIVAAPRGLLADIVTGLVEAETDMKVVARLPTGAELGDALGQVHGDVLVLGAESALRRVEPLLWQQPRLKILTVTGDGRKAYLSQLRPQTASLGELSPAVLLGAIRSVRTAPVAPPDPDEEEGA